MGTCCTASMASRFSVSETGSPAVRSSWMKPSKTSSTKSASGCRRGQLLGRLGDVGLVLQEDVQGLGGLLAVDLRGPEEQERARPVQGLGHRGSLLQLELANAADDPC